MTPKFMLDTDSVSYALRGVGDIGRRILQHRPSELCISAVTLAELRFGAHRRSSSRLQRLIDTFVRSVSPREFDSDAADEYGRLAAELSKRGTPIGAFDTMIAAHAASRKLVLVTSNEKHFRKIRGLKIENWA